MRHLLCLMVLSLMLAFPAFSAPAPFRTSEYPAMKQALMRGWNTWDTRSVLTHVFLPEGLAIRLQLQSASGRTLKHALIGRQGAGEEQVSPGAHAYDGSYTELSLQWQGMRLRVQTAAAGDHLAILVTPEPGSRGSLIIRPEIFYGRPGRVVRDGHSLRASLPSRSLDISVEGPAARISMSLPGPHLSVPLDGPVGICVGARRSLGEITAEVEAARQRLITQNERYGDLRNAHDAQQSVLAWNVIYDPSQDRVIVPVSRIWNVNWGGYVIFDWDSYFAAYMLSLDSRDLAYAMAVEVTRGITCQGFIPNYAQAGEPGSHHSHKSLDRSQPPVGSLMVREIYRRHRDRWFLREVFDDLLTWNRWFEQNRVTDGYLCWGSHRYAWDWLRKPKELYAINNWQGAAWESGLDNSPMYDGVPFNKKTHQLALADAGLMGFYVSDCEALADLAGELGRPEAAELRTRAALYRRNLERLWHEESGIYLNRRTDTGEWSFRLSPTNFYPMLGRCPSQAQAGRMVKEHFYNDREFFGEWIMPSIARNDPAFADNTYWRGRIWAPMNFLVYLGLRNYDLPEARRDLAERSRALLEKSWLAEGHVYENYNAVHGRGDDVENADRFYHWGALLGFISFIEKGFVNPPEAPLNGP